VRSFTIRLKADTQAGARSLGKALQCSCGRQRFSTLKTRDHRLWSHRGGNLLLRHLCLARCLDHGGCEGKLFSQSVVGSNILRIFRVSPRRICLGIMNAVDFRMEVGRAVDADYDEREVFALQGVLKGGRF